MKTFRILSYVEAASLLALFFIAMPLKYFAGMPEAVRIVGSLHGVLFLMFVYSALTVGRKHGWSFERIMWAIIIASIPFGPFLFKKKLFGDSVTVSPTS